MPQPNLTHHTDIARRSPGALVVYTPNDRQQTGVLASLVSMVRNIHACRQLILQMFLRDFLAGYRKSFFGIAWIVISPLLSIVTWIFMNATGVLSPGATSVPYPVYLLLGTTLWTLFLGFYTAAAGTLGAGQGLILQVKYPHEALLAKQTLEPLANFGITFVLDLVILFAFGVSPSPWTLLLPLAILPLFFLGAGLGLIAGVVGVVAQEAKRTLDILIGMALFVTPVIYSSRHRSWLLETVTGWNPLTFLIGGARDLILQGDLGSPRTFLWVSAGTFVFFVVCLRLFFVTEDRVIEKIL